MIGSGVLPPCSMCPGWDTCTVALPAVFCRQCHVSRSVAKIVVHVKISLHTQNKYKKV